MNKYNQELPVEVEVQLDQYIERIKAIKWFQPQSTLSKEEIEKQVGISLKAFGFEASIEYRQLKTPADWDAARNAAWDAAWNAAWGAAWSAAWGALDILALNVDEYKKKYPNGNLISLIPLYELGLYPIGVVDGKFVIAIPASKMEFPEIK